MIDFESAKIGSLWKLRKVWYDSMLRYVTLLIDNPMYFRMEFDSHCFRRPEAWDVCAIVPFECTIMKLSSLEKVKHPNSSERSFFRVLATNPDTGWSKAGIIESARLNIKYYE